MRMLADMLMMAANRPIELFGTPTKTSNASNGSTLTIAKPSGLPVGTLVYFIGFASGAVTWTPPSGFTEREDFNTSGMGGVFERVLDGSEGANFTATADTSGETLSGAVFAVSNGVFDLVGALTSLSSPIVAPAITLTKKGYAFQIYARIGASVTFTTPSGCTPLISDSDGDGPSFAIFYKAIAAAGSSGTASSTPSSLQGYGYQLGVKQK